MHVGASARIGTCVIAPRSIVPTTRGTRVQYAVFTARLFLAPAVFAARCACLDQVPHTLSGSWSPCLVCCYFPSASSAAALILPGCNLGLLSPAGPPLSETKQYATKAANRRLLRFKDCSAPTFSHSPHYPQSLTIHSRVSSPSHFTS